MPYSLAPSATALISGTNIIPLDPRPSSYGSDNVLTVAGKTFVPISASNYIIGTQTLIPGADAITLDGVTCSIAHSATALISGTSTIMLTLKPSFSSPNNVLTVAGTTYTQHSASQYIIGTQTLAPRVTAITVDGSRYSLVPGGGALISGTEIMILAPEMPAITNTTKGGSIITIAGIPYTINSASKFVVGSQTFHFSGGTITIDGTIYSLAPSAMALTTGSSVIPLASSARIVTIGGAVYTANTASAYLIGSQKLLPGSSALTIPGVKYSLAPSATTLISGSSTILLRPSAEVITIDDLIYTAGRASDHITGSQTLRPGAPAIIVSGGEVISLAVGGTSVVVVSSGRTTTESMTGLGGAIVSEFGDGPTIIAAVTAGLGNENNLIAFADDANMVDRRCGPLGITLVLMAAMIYRGL